MAAQKDHPVLYTLFGLNRAGRILYLALFVLAVPGLAGWNVLLTRLRFSDEDERLFRPSFAKRSRSEDLRAHGRGDVIDHRADILQRRAGTPGGR